MEIILASYNAHKAREIGAIMSPIVVKSLGELGVEMDFDAVEDGETYSENALKKVHAAAAHVKGIIVSDDSGLEVAALDGRPGLLSARYGGADITDQERCGLLLDEMKTVPDGKRAARFVCIVAALFPDGREELFEGELAGVITREIRGGSGFGYDPVIFLPERGVTVAELAPGEKNKISHRSTAFGKLKQYLLNG